jgi:hypothetical protein
MSAMHRSKAASLDSRPSAFTVAPGVSVQIARAPERAVEVTGAAHLDRMKLYSKRLRRTLRFPEFVVGMIRIPQERHLRDARRCFLEQLEALGR